MDGSSAATPGPRCTECGGWLASRIRPDGVVVLADQSVPFRRDTDFVVCDWCLATFRAADVRLGRIRPV